MRLTAVVFSLVLLTFAGVQVSACCQAGEILISKTPELWRYLSSSICTYDSSSNEALVNAPVVAAAIAVGSRIESLILQNIKVEVGNEFGWNLQPVNQKFDALLNLVDAKGEAHTILVNNCQFSLKPLPRITF